MIPYKKTDIKGAREKAMLKEIFGLQGKWFGKP
jgi:hypothetical protein